MPVLETRSRDFTMRHEVSMATPPPLAELCATEEHLAVAGTRPTTVEWLRSHADVRRFGQVQPGEEAAQDQPDEAAPSVQTLIYLLGPEAFCFGFAMFVFCAVASLVALPWTPLVALTMAIVWGPMFLWLIFTYVCWKLSPLARGIYNYITKE